MTGTPGSTNTGRIPLNTFAIGFGLAGLAEVWSTAGETLGLPAFAAQVFWTIATIAWIWLIVAHLRRGARTADTLTSQLRHPAQGPIAALAAITGMLIADNLFAVAKLLHGSTAQVVQVIAVTLFIAMLVVAAVFAGWLISTWLQGNLPLEAIHGGYLLPTVAAGFVGAEVAADAGLIELSFALFGVGVFFWVVMTVLLVIRLALRPSLPDPLVPTMAILVAPPAVAGLAWFAQTGAVMDQTDLQLAGIGVLLVLVQLALIPRYRRLKFSLGFWSFTFPSAAVIADAVIWLEVTRPVGWQVATIVLVVAITGFVAAIAVRTLMDVVPRRGGAADEAVLVAADDVDAGVTREPVPGFRRTSR